jgi:hypothetical protein
MMIQGAERIAHGTKMMMIKEIEHFALRTKITTQGAEIFFLLELR